VIYLYSVPFLESVSQDLVHQPMLLDRRHSLEVAVCYPYGIKRPTATCFHELKKEVNTQYNQFSLSTGRFPITPVQVCRQNEPEISSTLMLPPLNLSASFCVISRSASLCCGCSSAADNSSCSGDDDDDDDDDDVEVEDEEADEEEVRVDEKLRAGYDDVFVDRGREAATTVVTTTGLAVRDERRPASGRRRA
jgi:hypothetical protein